MTNRSAHQGRARILSALSELEAEVRAVAPIEAYGVLTSNGLAGTTLQMRGASGTVSYVVTEEPCPVRATAGNAAQFVRPSSHADAAAVLATLQLPADTGRLVLTPLSETSVLWAASQDSEELAPDGLKTYVSVAERILSRARRAESSEDGAARLRRIDRLEALLHEPEETRDVQAAFERVAFVAEQVLPHDTIRLELRGPDGVPTQVDARERSSRVAELPPPSARVRSSLRVPIRARDRSMGILEIVSSGTRAYDDSDVAVALRLADGLALALAGHRLAEESRMAEAFRERTASLERLDGLRDALKDVLDVRQVFDRVSLVARSVLPHDLLGVLEVTETGDRVRLHATSADTPTFELPVAEPDLLTKPWDVIVIDDLPSHPAYGTTPAAKAGMKSVLSVPVRFGGRLRAAVNFFSREPRHFTRADLPVAQRIAGYVALAMSHHRLAEEARQRQALEARAATLAMLDHSLASIVDGGEVRALFDRVSAIARQVLPHDAMGLSVLQPDGRHARRYATSGLNVGTIPDLMEVPQGFVRDPDWEFDLIEDVATRAEPLNQLVAKLGMRSVLRVPVRLDGRFVGVLAFMARTQAFFVMSQIEIARRIGDRVALGLEHERGFEAGRRADAANERAARLEARVRTLTEELDARTGARRVIGESAPWRAVLTQAAQVAATDTTVLLLGETGTGKEVVARFLHRASKRCDDPFVALNCAALPEHLLESELFGHERGAFTGALQSKPGQIEQAARGVLFLDEVGEMTPSVQAKFLRVLQEREFQRLGGTRVLRADVRVIAATNRDLRKAMERGTFREDLYYRLSVFEIRLPPLRERRGDILPLSEAVLDELGRGLGRPPSGISRDARQALVEYHWPGNVRELRNMLERAAILADGGLIVREHLTLAPPRAALPPEPSAASPDLPSVERTMIEQALKDARFNKSQAARALGLTRAQLYVRLKRHGLD